jgi:PAS domain S-box-containing protein
MAVCTSPPGSVGTPDLADQISKLKPGGHLCLFYDKDPAEQMPALVPFIRDGLSLDEQCIYIADDQTLEDLAGHLVNSSIDVAAETESGRLRMLTREHWRQSGELDSSKKAEQVRAFIAAAAAAGYRGVRFAIEMTWILGPDIDSRQLEHWEASINTLLDPSFPARVICQYNRSRLSPDVLSAALHTHPDTMVGESIYPNAQDASRFLAAIVESSDDAIITKDLNGRITSWNQGAERLFGYTAGEVIGKPISLLIPFERLNEEPGILGRVRKGERIDHYETVRRRKDGTLVEISLTVSPVRGNDGRIIGASKIARNITDRKQAEQALLAGEDRFRAIADNIAQLAWTANQLGEGTWYNRRWYDYTGTTFEQMKGRGWETVQHPDHSERVGAKLKATLQRGDEWEDTFPLRRRDGEYRWFLSRAVPIRDETGNIRCWFGTNTDITELREAREELSKSHATLEQRVKERTASLEQAIAQMEEFSYSVSHDLRGPVRAMAGYAQAVIEDYGERLDSRGRDYLDRILRGSARMQRLIHDVLTYSRLARCDIQLQAVSLQRLLPDIIQQYPEMQLPHAEIIIREPLQPVMAHEPSLTQAISNLLSNGVKFVALGTRPKLQVWTETRQDKVRLWVEDNGIGIKPEHQRRLFGMFERVHQEKTYDGTGIGLAIVRKAIERMGGAVGVESDGITGSSFWIELPGPPS